MKLKQLIKEIKDEDELNSEIEIFKTTEKQISDLENSIKETMAKLESLNKENKKRFNNIEKFMKRFSISVWTAKQWTAKLESVLKYKVPRPDYKSLWLEGLTKVNEATKKVLVSLQETQLELKRKETTNVLTIEANIIDKLKSLWMKIKNLFSNIMAYEKVVKKLPKIN